MPVDPRACGAAAYLLAMSVVVVDHPRWAGLGGACLRVRGFITAGIHHSGDSSQRGPDHPRSCGASAPVGKCITTHGPSPARTGRSTVIRKRSNGSSPALPGTCAPPVHELGQGGGPSPHVRGAWREAARLASHSFWFIPGAPGLSWTPAQRPGCTKVHPRMVRGGAAGFCHPAGFSASLRLEFLWSQHPVAISYVEFPGVLCPDHQANPSAESCH